MSKVKSIDDFKFTLLMGDQKIMTNAASALAYENPKIKAVVEDALKHIDRSRGPHVTLIFNDKSVEESPAYTIQQKKFVQRRVIQEIPLMETFLERPDDANMASSTLNRFFRTILVPFKQINHLWRQFRGKDERDLKLDMQILQEVSHSVEPGNKLSRSQCLKYMIKTLKKERAIKDYPLIDRLEKALENSRKVEQIRKKYAAKGEFKHDGDFKKVVKSFQSQIVELENDNARSKFLMPVGYSQEGTHEEMFLEIAKVNNTFTIHLITQSDKESAYFHKAMMLGEIRIVLKDITDAGSDIPPHLIKQGTSNMKTVGRSLSYSVEGINQNDLLSKISTLVEYQVNPKLTEKVLDAEAEQELDLETIEKQLEGKPGEGFKMPKIPAVMPQRTFYTLFKFEGATVIATPEEKQINIAKKQGNLRTLISYLNHDQDKLSDPKRDLALRLNAFLHITKESDKWIKNNAYRELVLNTSYSLVDLLENHREELFGPDEIVQNQKIEEIIAKINAVRAKIEATPPASPNLKSMKLNSFRSTPFTSFTSKEIPPLKGSGLTVIPFKSEQVTLDPDNLFDSLKFYVERLKKTEGSEQSNFENEVSSVSRFLVKNIDQLTNLDEPELSIISQAVNDISEVLTKNIEKKRKWNALEYILSNIKGGELNEKRSIEEGINAAALLIVSSTLAQRKIDLNPEKATLRSDTLTAPARSLGFAVMMLRDLQYSSLLQPSESQKNSLVGSEQQDLINYCTQLITKYDEPFKNYQRVTYPSTQDAHLSSSIHLIKSILMARSPEKINKKALEKYFKNVTPLQLDFLQKPENLIVMPTPPVGFKLRDSFDDYSYEELDYFLAIANLFEVQTSNLTIKKKTKTLTDRELSLYNEIPNVKRIPFALYKYATLTPHHFHIEDGFFFSKAIKSPIENPLSEEINNVKFENNLGEWSANPHKILTHLAKKYPRDVIQDIITARFNESSWGSTPKENQITQAENLLLCFSKHPELFQDHEMRLLLEETLFKNTHSIDRNEVAAFFKPQAQGSILYDMAKEGNLELILGNFSDTMTKSIKQNQELGKLENASYIIHFMSAMRTRIPENQKHLFDSFFTSTSSEPLSPIDYQFTLLNEAADSKAPDQSLQQNAIAARILEMAFKDYYNSRSPQELFTEDFLTQVVVAFAHFEKSGGSIQLNDKAATQRFENLKTVVYKAANQKIQENPEFANHLVTTTLASLMPDYNNTSMEWSLSSKGFPLFEKTEKGISSKFEIERGILYTGGKHIEILPTSLRADQDVKRLFTQDLKTPWEKVSTKNPMDFAQLSVYKHPHDPKIRILLKEPLNKEGSSTGEPSKIRIERSSHHHKNSYMTYHRFLIQDDIKATDLPANVAHAIGNRDCWISRDGKTIEVTDGGELFATLKLKVTQANANSPLRAEVVSVERADGKTSLAVSKPLHERMGHISTPEEILVYGKEGHPRLLEYPKLLLSSNGNSLSYSIRGSDIFCDAFPGYKLVSLGEKAPEEALPLNFRSYQIIERGGVKKVLIPFGALQTSPLSNDEYRDIKRSEAFRLTESAPTINAKTVFEFNLNPETKKLEIYKPEGDAYLFLSYIAFANHDYKLANFYLEKSLSYVATLETYGPIFDMIEKENDRSVEGRAILLKMALMKESMIEKERHSGNLAGNLSIEDTGAIERAHRIKDLYDSYQAAVGIKLKGVNTSKPLDKNLYLNPNQKALAQKIILKNALTGPVMRVAGVRIDAPYMPPPMVPLPYIPLATPEMIWLLAKNKNKVEGSIENQKWETEQFFQIAEQIVNLDKDSLEFKELATRIKATIPTLSKQAKNIVSKASSLIEDKEVKDFDDDAPEIPTNLARKVITNPISSFKTMQAGKNSLVEVASLLTLVNLVGQKEAGKLEGFSLTPVKRPGNLLIRAYKLARLEIFLRMFNLSYTITAPQSLQNEETLITPVNKAEILDLCKDFPAPIPRFLFRGCIKKLAKAINDSTYGDDIPPQEIVKIMRTIILGKSESKMITDLETILTLLQKESAELLANSINQNIPKVNTDQIEEKIRNIVSDKFPDEKEFFDSLNDKLKDKDPDMAEVVDAIYHDRPLDEEKALPLAERLASTLHDKAQEGNLDLDGIVAALINNQVPTREMFPTESPSASYANPIEEIASDVDYAGLTHALSTGETPTLDMLPASQKMKNQRIKPLPHGMEEYVIAQTLDTNVDPQEILGYLREGELPPEELLEQSNIHPELINALLGGYLPSEEVLGKILKPKQIEASKLLTRDIAKIEKRLEIAQGTPPSLGTQEEVVTTARKVPLLHVNGVSWKKSFEKVEIPQKLDTKVFDEEGGDVQFIIDEHKKGLETYQKEVHDPLTYLIDKKDVETHLNHLSDLERNLTEKRDFHKDTISILIDSFDSPAALRQLKKETGQTSKPALEDLLAIWRRGELTNEWKDNPLRKLGLSKISESDLQLYDVAIREYLATVTELGQLKRAESAALDYIASVPAKHHVGNPHLAKKYYELVTAKRHYTKEGPDQAGDPDYRKLLYMEFRLNFCLRENQLKTFREMLANPNAVRQLDMGGGKTSIILPLLAEFKANGQNLVTLVLPDALYESIKRDIESRNRELFAKPFFCFEFNRETDLSYETLGTLYKNMLDTIEQQGFVLTKKGYKLSFLNSFKRFEHELSESVERAERTADGKVIITPEIQEKLDQFKMMCKIAELMKTREQSIGDEIDLVSDVRQEVNFGLGDKEPIDDTKLELGRDLLLSCFSSKKSSLIKLKNALASNSQATLNEKEKELALHDLAKVYLKGLDKDQLSLLGSREALLEYVTQKNCQEYPGDMEALKKDNPELYRQITALRAFLTVGLPAALTKSCDVNYGRDPVSNKFTIPYKASNTPSLKSEFDEEIERITYTLLDYAYKGFSHVQIAEFIEQTRQTAIKQKNLDPETFESINDTPAAIKFAEFIKSIDESGKMNLPTNLKSYDTEEKIDRLLKALNKTPESKIGFCHELILKEIRSLNHQIKSNSEDLASLSQSYGGFTGTPWNRFTYADKMEPILNEAVDGKTWQRLLSKPISITVVENNPSDPIGMILNGNPDKPFLGNYQVLVDTGAYLKGKNNRDFIDAVLIDAKAKKLPVQNGVYYNEAGQIVCLQQGAKNPVPINSAPETDLRWRVNLYDQSHTTGADLPNYKKAVACVTIGEDTFVRDLFQAVWRLRALNEEQDIAFFMSDKVRDLIMEGKGDPKNITVKDILSHAMKMQGIREAEDNWRAEKEKVAGTPERMMSSILMTMGSDPHVNDDQLLKTIGVFGKHVLHSRTKESMYASYADLPKEVSPQEAYDETRQKALAKIKGLKKELINSYGNTPDKPVLKKLKITKEHINERELKHEERLPRGVMTSSQASQNAGTEVEVETEVAVETAVETQQEVQTEFDHIDRPSKEERFMFYYPTEFEALLQPKVSSRIITPISEHIPQIDSGLYFTVNHQRMEKEEPISETLLSSRRKPIRKLFALQRPDTSVIMVIATDHEVQTIVKKYMVQKKGNPLKMAVVGITPLGPMVFARSGKGDQDLLPFTGDSRAAFMNLYVQAKFIDGQTHYNKEEKEALREFLSKQEGDMRAFFEKEILEGTPHQAGYSRSVLYRLFEELKQGPAVASSTKDSPSGSLASLSSILPPLGEDVADDSDFDSSYDSDFSGDSDI